MIEFLVCDFMPFSDGKDKLKSVGAKNELGSRHDLTLKHLMLGQSSSPSPQGAALTVSILPLIQAQQVSIET